jgi:O-antigen/teichoic acid export membrane protein
METTGRPAPHEGPTDRSRTGPTTRRTARNAAVVAAAEVAGKVATLVFTVAAARTLGTTGFGAFSYALSFSLLVATLPSGGFGPILVQRGSADPRRLPQLLSELLVWRTGIAIPVFLGSALAGFALEPDVRSVPAFLLILAATMVDLYSDAGRSVAGALQRQGGVSAALIVQRFATAVLAVTALALGFGLVGLAATYLAGTVIGATGVLLSVRRMGVRFDLRSMERRSFLQTGRMSVAVGIDTMVALALFRVDQVILGSMKGTHAVGLYAAAYKLLETVLFLSWAVARAVYPVMSSANDRWRVRRGVEQGIAAMAFLYVPFGVALWLDAHQILQLLYAGAYSGPAAVTITRWLAASPMLFGMAYLSSYGLLARDRRWWAAWGTIAAAAINVGLNLALIPHLGGTGAAIATLVAYAAETVLVLALCVPVMGWVRVDRALAVPLVAAALMAGALIVAPSTLAVQVPVGLAVYGIAWLALARWFAREQLAVIRSLLPGRGAHADAAAPPG